MNKYLILLGLVLIASLSFAQPENWMQSVEYRYGCMFEYNDYLLDEAVDGCTMGEDNYNMLSDYMWCGGKGITVSTCMDNDLFGMFRAADCPMVEPRSEAEVDGANPAIFRTYMSGFNANNFLFKQKFNSLVRECIAGTLIGCTCDREDLLGDLQGARATYMACLNEREPYCWSPAFVEDA